jgi:hypothetical protein
VPTMNFMRTVTTAVGIIILLAASSCALREHEYKLPITEVYQRLVASELQDMVKERICGVDVNIVVEGQPENSAVVWRVMSSGDEQLRFTARLTPISDNVTKVEIDIWNKKDGAAAYDGTKVYKRPVLEQPVRLGIEEQVDSILKGRPYAGSRKPYEGPPGTFGTPPITDSVCKVQAAGREEGVTKFTTRDDGAEATGEGGSSEISEQAAQQREIERKEEAKLSPGDPSPVAGRPTATTDPMVNLDGDGN